MWAVSCCYLIGIVLRTEEPFLNADTWEEVSTNISFSHFYKGTRQKKEKKKGKFRPNVEFSTFFFAGFPKALVITVKVANINR